MIGQQIPTLSNSNKMLLKVKQSQHFEVRSQSPISDTNLSVQAHQIQKNRRYMTQSHVSQENQTDEVDDYKALLQT